MSRLTFQWGIFLLMLTNAARPSSACENVFIEPISWEVLRHNHLQAVKELMYKYGVIDRSIDPYPDLLSVIQDPQYASRVLLVGSQVLAYVSFGVIRSGLYIHHALFPGGRHEGSLHLASIIREYLRDDAIRYNRSTIYLNLTADQSRYAWETLGFRPLRADPAAFAGLMEDEGPAFNYSLTVLHDALPLGEFKQLMERMGL